MGRRGGEDREDGRLWWTLPRYRVPATLIECCWTISTFIPHCCEDLLYCYSMYYCVYEYVFICISFSYWIEHLPSQKALLLLSLDERRTFLCWSLVLCWSFLVILAWDNQKGTFWTHFVNFGHEGAPNVTKLTYNMIILWENSHRKKNWGSFVHRGLRYDFLRKKIWTVPLILQFNACIRNSLSEWHLI